MRETCKNGDIAWNKRSAHTRGLVPAASSCNKSPEEFTRRDWSQGLVPRTIHAKRLEVQVAGTCPKNSSHFIELTRGASRKDQTLLPVTRIGAKMASSHHGTCSRDLSQGLVPSCLPTLSYFFITKNYFVKLVTQ